MKKTAQIFVIIAIHFIIASGASAHAFLDHADPKVGGKVTAPPSAVKLWFSEKLEPSLSKAQIFSADGNPVGKQISAVDPANHALLTVSFPPLKPGKYKVVWKAVSVDTHLTKGDFTFEVSP